MPGCPSAPSTTMMTNAEAPSLVASACSWLRSSTWAAVDVAIGRRLVPAGPLTGDKERGREGRERPDLPRA